MNGEFPVDQQASSCTGGSIALGFVLGAVIGAGVAFLLAPMSGAETRSRLTDAGRRIGGAARNKVDQARDTIDRARDTVDRVRDAVGERKADVGATLTR